MGWPEAVLKIVAVIMGGLVLIAFCRYVIGGK